MFFEFKDFWQAYMARPNIIPPTSHESTARAAWDALAFRKVVLCKDQLSDLLHDARLYDIEHAACEACGGTGKRDPKKIDLIHALLQASGTKTNHSMDCYKCYGTGIDGKAMAQKTLDRLFSDWETKDSPIQMMRGKQ